MRKPRQLGACAITLALTVACQVLRLIFDQQVEEDGLSGGRHHRELPDHIATARVRRAQH